MLLQRKGLLFWLGVFQWHSGFERPREQQRPVPECATHQQNHKSYRPEPQGASAETQNGLVRGVAGCQSAIFHRQSSICPRPHTSARPCHCESVGRRTKNLAWWTCPDASGTCPDVLCRDAPPALRLAWMRHPRIFICGQVCTRSLQVGRGATPGLLLGGGS